MNCDVSPLVILQGESLECPETDCGDPTLTLPSGSQVVAGSFTTTIFNSTFEIECAALYTQVSVPNIITFER